MKSLRFFAPLALLLLAAPARGQMDIVSVSPGSGEAGTSLDITVVGGPDCIMAEYSEVLFTPATGITHGYVTLVEYNSVTTTIDIPAGTASGVQTVTVLTGANECTNGVFLVTGGGGNAVLQSISPDSGAQGESLTVTVTGVETHFDSSTTLDFTGSGISVQTVDAQDETHLSAAIVISDSANPGLRGVTATTGAEQATGDDLFEVLEVSLSLSPDSAEQGTILASLTLTGAGVGSATGAHFDADITIGAVTSGGSDTLVLQNVSVAADAWVGWHDLTLDLPGGSRTYPAVFTVSQGPQTILLSIAPSSADRGHPGLAVAVTGQNTRFSEAEDLELYLAGGDAPAAAETVVDDTHLEGRLILGRTTAEGPRDVALRLHGYCDPDECARVVLTEGFDVTPPGTIDAIDPYQLNAGEERSVAISATDGNFATGATSLTFDPPDGIEVLSLAVTDADHLQAQLRISADAPGDLRFALAVTGTEVAFGEDALDIFHPEVRTLEPAAFFRGFTGLELHIGTIDIPLDAASAVEISGTGVTVAAVTFDPATPDEVVATVNVDATASLGARDVTVRAGTIEATATGGLTIMEPPEPKTEGCGCSAATAEPGAGGWLLLLGFLFVRRRRTQPSVQPSNSANRR